MASVDGTSRREWSGGRDKPCHLTTSKILATSCIYMYMYVCGTHKQASCRGVSPTSSVQLMSTSVL